MSNYSDSQEIDYILQNYDVPDEIVTDILYKLQDVIGDQEEDWKKEKEELEGLQQKLGFNEREEIERSRWSEQ